MLFFFQSFLFDRQDASPTIIESKILRVVLRFLIPKMINFNLFTFSLLSFTNCLSFMILTISFGAAPFANFYRPQTKFAKVMFLHLSVSHSVHREGVCLSACWDTPRKQKPPGSRHPHEQCMLGDTVNKRAVCILLECNLVIQKNLTFGVASWILEDGVSLYLLHP